MPEPAVDRTVWWRRRPPVLVPVPATEATGPLTGCRIIVAQDGLWLYDQRACTEIHSYRGGRVVGVLDEAEWYRTQREPDLARAVPHPRPVEQIWVEQPVELDAMADEERPELSGTLVEDTSRPPVRWLRPATAERAITGTRVWVISSQGPIHGLRALGEPRREAMPTTLNLSAGLDGLDEPVVGTVIPVATESEWYRWRQSSQRMQAITMAAQFVWLE